MVYYGKLSKGCQRCRQRKVKCDQARPTCQRCERSGLNCPGYRNLNAIIFRDETKRIIGQVSRQQGWHSTSNDDCLRSGASSNPVSSLTSPFMARSAISSPIPLHDIPSRPLSQCIQDLAVNFFFNKYTYSEPQFFSDYRDWLSECYQDQVNDVLRAALEAVGLAGLSNVSAGAEVLARQSRKKYCRALVCMRDTLNDPIRAVADTTLMTVMLLILFETVNFDTWDQYRCWEAHVRAATALLELRGQEQFNREGGALLYIQLRSEILFNCIQHHEYVHPALVQATYIFQTSPIRHQWRSRGVASPGSICEIAFRIVNLYADFEGSDVRS
ncbi:hypothetical protein M433DRAFT_384154 [Acidomyces richmondensis BFW]|nr:MAG: hypothetical protein FE78DRAFT_523646 [Acidomyces sp. 'richmondensis']KYG42889.1 hypothetical protein M433DRAFT_384154 [Acidomyces richmondensis BFW]